MKNLLTRSMLLVAVALAMATAGCAPGAAHTTRWPATAAGKPTFYYFGTPT